MHTKRIKTPTHVRQVISEQINILRAMPAKSNAEKINRAKAVAYLSTVALTAIRDGELEARLQRVEELYGITQE